ncbi:hypothetical protein N7476_008011 [Penicillium atrosanguineum]|uniref:Uncharacterized protein n=1 Tax=Penicillium atrosanguineum TaxID=1132637 RepID=A0A9W9U266_9EURO|nr:hypothetical protein N7476_008011 [Penicillium atrosanguineum]
METDLATAMSMAELSSHVPLCYPTRLLCFVNIPDLWNFVEEVHVVFRIYTNGAFQEGPPGTAIMVRNDQTTAAYTQTGY